MIGNSCLKSFLPAMMRALVLSTKPPDFPITSPRYQKVDTDSNVSSATCTWVEFELSGGTLSPLYLLHLNMFFLQCSFNSQASFMNPEVAGLTKYCVYTNSIGTHSAGPFNVCCLVCILSLTRQAKYLSLALIYS